MATLSSILPPVSVSTASGTLPAGNGGTGLTSPGTSGNALISDGTGWVSGTATMSYPQNIQSGNYTLVLGDAGKQIYSANTGAQTITIPTNASVAFPIGSVITIVNEGTTDIFLAVSGVTVKPNTSSSTLSNPVVQVGNSVQLLKTGTDAWKATFGVIIQRTVSATYLVIAGGGGAKGLYEGGAGAGGYLTSTAAIPYGTSTITVGAGGAASTNGANSSIGSSVIAIGGGTSGATGGSGGGGDASANPVGAGTAGQGFAGGIGNNFYGPGVGAQVYESGSGGGAGGVGGPGSSYGPGGPGLSSSITGTAVTRGGGGGGHQTYGFGGNGSAGGTGGGGAGSRLGGTAGTANTGGGGGSTSAAGGSGVVIIRVPTAQAATSTTGSPTITTSGSDTIYVFNSSGTITW
jgi:hypothetical protein